jgi:protein CpxP
MNPMPYLDRCVRGRNFLFANALIQMSPELEETGMKGTTIKLAGLGLGLILTAGAALAQDASGTAAPAAPATAASQNAPAEQNKLGLTADQKQKLRDIRTQARDRAAIINKDASLTPEQKQQQLQALHEQTKQQTNAVLTPEQQAQFAQKREQHMDKMKQSLGLNDQQVQQLKDLQSQTRTQREQVLNDKSLTQDQKAAKLADIRTNHDVQLKTILTPDQLAKFQKARGHRGMHKHASPTGL